ncbi:hypothetical protein VaNZ11_013427 [Volvox africanus]|uniref:Uncharacterized protein n=1 Tax=Volvox africanus TaxID=51714 RepID=A0ABQ5SG07_9CHLO|nr:hypothetical protein VaNZ11_013427 [Volvox africanus]
MENDTLERTTNSLRTLLLEKVPDILLQAECGGGLELPTPLPWGFANIPSLHELADIAKQELVEELRAQENVASRRWRNYEQPSSSNPQDISGGEERCLCEQQQQQQQQQEQAQQFPQSATRQHDVDDYYHPQEGKGVFSETAAEADREGHEGRPAVVHRNSPADGRPLDVPEEACGRIEAGGRHLGPDIQPSVPRANQCFSAASNDEDAKEDGRAATGDWAAEASAREAAGTPGKLQVAACMLEPCNDEGDPVGAADEGAGAGGTDRCQDVPHRIEDPSLLHESDPISPCKPYACRAFLDALFQSRTFCSPHCEGAMAEAMSMTDMYDGLAGSTLWPPPRREDLEVLRCLLKDHINSRWALEAVKQGVAAAKQGNYADAHKAYTRALELDPGNAEAYVARGAAHANQRAFPDAERDLRRALELDPGHRNAATYLDAVLRHVAEQRQQLEALEEERQEVLRRQQDQEQDRRRQTVAAAGGVNGNGADGRWTAARPMAAADGRPVGQGARYGEQEPPSAPGRLQRDPVSYLALQSAGRPGKGAEGRRRGGTDDSDDSSGSSASSSGDGDNSDGTPGRGEALGKGGPLKPASDDIRRALEVVFKARKHKKKSKHKKHKKKHRKSKRRRHD